MESVLGSDWRMWRKRLGEELSFGTRTEDPMRHVNKSWIR